MDANKNSFQPVWHRRSIADIFRTLEVSEQGLSVLEARNRLGQYGPNRLKQQSPPSVLKRFLRQFNSLLIYILIASIVILFYLGHLTDAAVVALVVFLNALIGFIQAGRAEQAVNAISKLLTPRAVVRRDGVRCVVDRDELVPGDLVLLEAGDRVPADLRLINAYSLSVDEAILTGESVPADKQLECSRSTFSTIENPCMVFAATLVRTGQGEGIVVATGPDTEVGRISGLLENVQTLSTPLLTEFDRLARGLSICILAGGASLLLAGWLLGHADLRLLFIGVVALCVAAIPEGLPAVLTIAMSRGVQIMAKRNAIVRRLPALEALGSVSVICTDKTGTLTRNEMFAAHIKTSEHSLKVDGEGYQPAGTLTSGASEIVSSVAPALQNLAMAMILCNDACIAETNGVWHVQGDPMEGALIACAGKMMPDVERLRTRWTRTDAIPFNPRQRFMATLVHDHEGHAIIFVKGAPEVVLAMCKHQSDRKAGHAALDIGDWNDWVTAMTGQGHRVIALAQKAVSPKDTVLERSAVVEGLELLGLVGLVDPLRSETRKAIESCHSAGIEVKMITGDHAQTASAIAVQAGLLFPSQVITGFDIDRMDHVALCRAVRTCNVFARTSPEHKLRLVECLQSNGKTVAMTGDGVNDAPALKRADVGVAMGLKGSEAAREVAEIVLADDNFATIVEAVRQGRTVYDNLVKVVSWTLPTNAGEALTVGVTLLLGSTLPITPIQILWVNLATAITLGLGLAFEPSDEGGMRKPPRSWDSALIDHRLVWHIVFVSLRFLMFVKLSHELSLWLGYANTLASTVAGNNLVVLEAHHLFYIRNFGHSVWSWWRLAAPTAIWNVLSLIVMLQLCFTYLPLFNQFFGSDPVPGEAILMIMLFGASFFLILETEKRIRLSYIRI